MRLFGPLYTKFYVIHLTEVVPIFAALEIFFSLIYFPISMSIIVISEDRPIKLEILPMCSPSQEMAYSIT